MLLTARRQRRSTPGTATAAAGSLFATPRAGVGALASATADAAARAGAAIQLSTPVVSIARDGEWVITTDGDTHRVDHVVIAAPADVAARLLAGSAPEAARLLHTSERADVVMVTALVSGDGWPDRLRGLSGYLVPKPVQRAVTAVSFGSQKWAHWRPPGGGEILRISLGRDGAPVLHLDDDAIVDAVVRDVGEHLQLDVAPQELRITRWPGAFAQYRPHHREWVAAVDRSLPAGIAVTGASYRGIGIPACVRDARAVAGRVLAAAGGLEESPS